MSKRRVLGKSVAIPPTLSGSSSSNTEGSENGSSISGLSNLTLDSTASFTQTNGNGNGNGSSHVESSVVETLQCPICNESMITLSQLNTHLDDVHTTGTGDSSIDGSSNGLLSENDFKQWFKKKVVDKAQDVLRNGTSAGLDGNGNSNGSHPRKLKLDFFDNSFTFSESDSRQSSPSFPKSDTFSSGSGFSGTSSPMKANNNSMSREQLLQQQQLIIPREHWKKPLGNDICHMGSCHKHLNIKNGTVNCRKCGELYCNEHTFYRVKINRKLEYDSSDETGVWCRCCENCFVNKPGWKDAESKESFIQDATTKFKEVRKTLNDKKSLEVMILERRLFKFYDFYSQMSNNKMSIKQFEREVCAWEDDKNITNCRICDNRYQFFLLKKHHCRICGLTVCGDINTGCSMDVPINLLIDLSNIPDGNSTLNSNNGTSTKNSSINQIPKVPNDPSLRICITCKKQLFNKRLFHRDLQKQLSIEGKSEVFVIVDNINILKYKIAKILPEFATTITSLENSDKSLKIDNLSQVENKMGSLDKTNEIIHKAARQRVTLVSYFSKLENLAKRLALITKINEERLSQNREIDIPFDELRLAKSLYQTTISYLQENMSPLQKVPKNLRPISNANNNQEGAINSTSQIADTKPKLMKREVRELREKLMVLKEQQFLVSEMAESAKKQRRFDDFAALEKSIEELNLEIDSIEAKLGDEYSF